MKKIPLWTALLINKKDKKERWINIIAPEFVVSNRGKYLVTADKNIYDYFLNDNQFIKVSIFVGYVSNPPKKYHELPLIKVQEKKKDDWEK